MINILSTVLATPVTNQMEHTSSLTWLYWLLFPAFLIVAGIGALARRSKATKAVKQRTPLEVEQDRLIEWRRIVRETGLSPVAGMSAADAIELQEHRCRQLFQLQSDLHPGASRGGRNSSKGR